MFEALRMILKRGMQVGHRKVARVAGFGEQRKIGQAVLRHKRRAALECRGVPMPQPLGIEQGQGGGTGQRTHQHCGEGGRADSHRCLATIAATSSAGIPMGIVATNLPVLSTT